MTTSLPLCPSCRQPVGSTEMCVWCITERLLDIGKANQRTIGEMEKIVEAMR